ncbi:hypothetical protein LRS13_03420 [Svornostia abyssi]|uniref:Uncharacterized protein n=1 Tax=Svornostia abyssi TaxID=2898438 RepID=A0ABY5PJR8_9ACTN|nr:hypothetical protein LRS13_03420 [Parviterribacteraceae bacterium J379]
MPSVGTRNAAAGRLLVDCPETGSWQVVDLRTGRATALPLQSPAGRPMYFSAIGRRWVGGSGPCDDRGTCTRYIDLAAGRLETRPAGFTADLEATVLRSVGSCRGVAFNTYREGWQIFDAPYLARTVGRANALYRRDCRTGRDARLDPGFVSVLDVTFSDGAAFWPKGKRLIAARLRDPSVRQSWSVPGAKGDDIVHAVTGRRVIVGRVTKADKLDTPQAMKLFIGSLSADLT